METRLSAQTKRLIGSACAGALAAGCLAACGSANAAVSDLLTPAQAKVVLQAWLHAPMDAQVAQESGSLQRVDQAHAALSTPGPSPMADRGLHDDTIWVAHQTRYPISFLVFDRPLVGGGQISSGQLFRFSKQSASAAWQVTHQDELFANVAKPAVTVDADGYAQTVSTGDYGRLMVSPAKLAADWATYLQAQDVSDTREFGPGPLTTDHITGNKKDAASDASKHYSYTYTYAPTNDPVDAYRLADGGALVLVAIEATDHIHANAEPVSVTTDGKGITDPAPGSYRDVTRVLLVLGAFSVPPKGGTAKVTGVGVYFGPVTATGTTG